MTKADAVTLVALHSFDEQPTGAVKARTSFTTDAKHGFDLVERGLAKPVSGTPLVSAPPAEVETAPVVHRAAKKTGRRSK